MSKAPAIGIDLGTTYSCVGAFQNGKVEIFANAHGNRIIPSCVAFTDKGILTGDTATEQMIRNLKNTIFDVKRLIGRRYDDPTVQADMKEWPFTVIREGGKPKIQVQYKGETKNFLPEEISSMVLRQLKETAQTYLGDNVVCAVITVPVYFNDSQRQATMDAGKIAGLKVFRIINEPTAAAIAYGLDKKGDGKRNILIFDIGGGTFDVSILTVEDGSFKVKATGGDTHLGGVDFNKRMVKYFAEEFKRKHNKDLTTNMKAVGKLRTACERAKRLLSTITTATIDIDSLFEDIDFSSEISRAKFDDLNEDLFLSTIKTVEKTLLDAKMDKSVLNDIVLVGGSTRILRLQTLLKNFFNEKELNKSLNADEAVAYGAAIQAAILGGDFSKELRGVVVEEVTPLSLGVNITGGVMSVIIKRNTPIPTNHTKPYTTIYDNQTEVEWGVYQGERGMVVDNYRLGGFVLSGIPPAPNGVPKLTVKFSIDSNSILHVTAVEKSSGKEKSITITDDRSRLSTEEIERMVKDAQKYCAEDEKEKKRAYALNALETYCYNMKSAVKDGKLKDKICETDKNYILDKCNEFINWLVANKHAEKETFETQLDKLESVCNAITKMMI